MNEQWKELLEEIRPSCESISSCDQGVLVKIKQQLPFRQFIALYDQLTKAGAVHLMQSFTFLFPDPAGPHLARLRGVFKVSQAEIRESLLFLAENDFTPNQISSETGASLTTIYRYLGKR